MWEYRQRKFGRCHSSKTTTIRPWKRGGKGKMKAYGLMGRMIHMMTSGKMEKVRKIVVLTGSMQKTDLKREIATVARSETKVAI